MVSVGELREVWEWRLRMYAEGRRECTDKTKRAVGVLVERLRSLGVDEEIEIDADLERDPLCKFIRVSTGELLAELPQAHRTP
jgi:hypothetical protein